MATQNGSAHGDPGIDLLGTCYDRTWVVARGSDIGTSSGNLHVLVEGLAGKYRISAGGRRQILSLHLKGDVCDLHKLYCKPSLSYSIRAIRECRVASIPIRWLKGAIDERPAIRDLFWSLTLLQNEALTQLVTSLGGRTARERLAYFLCDLIARMQIRAQALTYPFRLGLTQTDLAEILGLSLVHINRVLQSLREDGLIAGNCSALLILDITRLRAVAGYVEGDRCCAAG